MSDFTILQGKTLRSVEVLDGNERVVFNCDDGTSYAAYHMQDCCESVSVEEVIGDLNAILNQPVIEAVEEQGQFGEPPQYSDSWTRTTHTIRTAGGAVTFSWLGESNGYYGETPYFGLTHEPMKSS